MTDILDALREMIPDGWDMVAIRKANMEPAMDFYGKVSELMNTKHPVIILRRKQDIPARGTKVRGLTLGSRTEVELFSVGSLNGYGCLRATPFISGEPGLVAVLTDWRVVSPEPECVDGWHDVGKGPRPKGEPTRANKCLSELQALVDKYSLQILMYCLGGITDMPDTTTGAQ